MKFDILVFSAANENAGLGLEHPDIVNTIKMITVITEILIRATVNTPDNIGEMFVSFVLGLRKLVQR